jgi:hypothetical protein
MVGGCGPADWGVGGSEDIRWESPLPQAGFQGCVGKAILGGGKEGVGRLWGVWWRRPICAAFLPPQAGVAWPAPNGGVSRVKGDVKC